MLTFVVVASTGPHPLPGPLVDRVDGLTDAVLLHRPDRRSRFASEGATALVRTWETTDPPTRWPAAVATTDGVAALAGWTWPVDGRAVDLDWLRTLIDEPDRVDDELGVRAGAFALLRVGRDGSGIVAADRSGGGLLYLGRHDGALIVSNRPDVVGAVLARGRAAVRDLDAVAWLPALGFLGDARTSLEGVSVLPVDARVSLTPTGAGLVPGTAPWHRPGPPLDVDAVADRLVRLVTAAAHHPAEDKRLLLSGGRDSRTLLAAAMEAGVADRFDLVTFGAEDHQDVVAARGVAAHVGLQVRRVEPPTHRLDDESFLHAARVHVGATSGMFGLWDLKDRHPAWTLRVTGLGGGFLHSLSRPVRGDGDLDTLTDDLLDAIRFDAGGILLPDVRADLRGRIRGWVAEELAAGTEPQALADVYYAAVHRRRWIGAAQELNTWGAQLAPLLDEELIRSGLAASTEDRVSGLHSLEILCALRPDLAELPLADEGWGRACIARYPELDVAPIRAPAHRPTDWHDRCWPDIEPVFRGHLQAHANPALTGLVDRNAIGRAIDRHERLDAHTKAQLWATLGVAIWTSGTDLAVRYPPDDTAPRPTARARLRREVDALEQQLATTTERAERAETTLARLRDRRVVRAGIRLADAVGRLRRTRRRPRRVGS